MCKIGSPLLSFLLCSLCTPLQALPLLKCGYTEENLTTANPADMEEYYSKEQQMQYGVVAFEIERITERQFVNGRIGGTENGLQGTIGD